MPPSGGPTMTVAVLHEQEGRTDAVVARLAELATADELVVILGSASAGESGYHAVIAGLRGRLPRHHVVAVHVPERGAQMDRHAASLERFLDAGSLPVAVTAPTSVPMLRPGSRVTSGPTVSCACSARPPEPTSTRCGAANPSRASTRPAVPAEGRRRVRYGGVCTAVGG